MTSTWYYCRTRKNRVSEQENTGIRTRTKKTKTEIRTRKYGYFRRRKNGY
jgi:hypothetical protein